MIPHSLTLKNFLSYGESPQTISFDEYGLICLSGKNGHGKSALLDAITWSLWGCGRKTVGTNKPDEGLLRLGATQMMVILEFESGGKQYRVRREFAMRNGKPHANLDFSAFDDSTDEYRSLTDKTIRRTQEKIEEVIGLDFDTFANSAFLRQGNANEFSSKSPKDRKKILAAILGVNRYDALQTKALEHAREVNQKIKVLQELQGQDEELFATEPQLKEQLIAEEKQVSELAKQQEGANKQLQLANQAFEQYQARKREHGSRLRELDERDTMLKNKRTAWLQQAQQWRDTHKELLANGDRAAIEAQLTQLRVQEKEQRTLQEAQLKQRERVMQVQQVLHVYEQLQVQAQQVAHDKARVAVQKKEIQDLEGQQQTFAKQLQAGAAEKAQFERRREWYAARAQQAKAWYAQGEELQEKEETIAKQEAPSCPLCEQMLSLKRKQFLQEKFSGERAKLSASYDRLTGALGALKKELLAQHERLKTHEQLRSKEQTLTTQITERTTQLQQLEKQCGEREQGLQTQHQAAAQAAAEKQIAVAPTISESFAIIKKTITDAFDTDKRHSYDEKKHAQIRENIEKTEKILHSFAEQQAQQGAQAEKRRGLSRQRIQLIEEGMQLADKRKALGSAGLDAAQEQQLERQLSDVQLQIKRLMNEKETILPRIGQLQTKLGHLKERREAYNGRAKQMLAFEQDKADYQALGTLWSKNGIQALLIEEAIPEIEHEANELLARLTQNQAQVFIESLRDLKRGGARETLDIKISDSMGVRPYEMFSGGEAFRIDFALRIAISKLLARRAGTALQLLIIDEGFGSQDEEGLSKLMAALYAIQSDFEKIIVVSHLPEFKENFPVHFVVNKAATGSVVTVEQRG